MAALGKTNTLIPWLIIFGLWAVLHAMLGKTVAAPVFDGALLGPDGYMRLVRIGELLGGTGWYESLIARSNAPYGDALHWTRPMDVIILTVATLASPFTDDAQALFFAGAVTSPIVAFFACIAMAWAARPVLGRDRAILAVIIFLLQPGVLSYTMLGRADHHSLQFVAFILCIGATLRLLSDRRSVRNAVVAGVSYGGALWVSIELLLLVGLCQATLAAVWPWRDRVFTRNQIILGGTFLATVLVALIIERPITGWFDIEYDRLSIVHVALAAIVTGFWLALYQNGHNRADATLRTRMTVAGIAGVAGLGVFGLFFPDFFAGPFASVDPRILPIWHDQVAELRPLVPTDMKSLGRFLFFIGAGPLCLVFLGIILWRERTHPASLRWAFLTVVLAVYFILSLKHLRFAPFAEIASAWALAEMVGRLMNWSEHVLTGARQFAVKCGATFFIILGALMSGTFVLAVTPDKAIDEKHPECKVANVAGLLNDRTGLGAQPTVVGGLLDYGPEFLYRTAHSVVGAPYHRNGNGIWDSYRLLAATDDAESQAIVKRRDIGIIVICPSVAERHFYLDDEQPDRLYNRLLADNPPDWLTPVPTDPDATSGFRIYTVRR